VRFGVSSGQGGKFRKRKGGSEMGKKIAFFLLVASIWALTLTEANAQRTLSIGCSLTYIGGGTSGRSVSDGVLDYLNWMASHGGIEYKDPVSGKNEKVALKITWEDNAWDITKAITVYKRLKARGVNMIFGIGSGPGEACAATASRDKLPYLCAYGTASPAGYKPKPQYYFCFQPTIGEVETPPIKWFIKQKWEVIGPQELGSCVQIYHPESHWKTRSDGFLCKKRRRRACWY
jgi:hypothetical protein